MKKLIIGVLIIFISLFSYCQYYTYDINKACKTITNNALDSSKCCCALFVMIAMNSGGCPIGLFPAWYYSNVLPHFNFKEVSINNYIPVKGDIIVVENSKEHFWGHIAMYNGNQWISDFKQKNMNPYKKEYKYKIFRYKCGQ